MPRQAKRVPSSETALKQVLGGKPDPRKGDSPLSREPSISHYRSAASRFLRALILRRKSGFLAAQKLSQPQRLA
jgi:hypothetical protein